MRQHSFLNARGLLGLTPAGPTTSKCRLLAVRPEGAHHLWRKNPPGELSIDPLALCHGPWLRAIGVPILPLLGLHITCPCEANVLNEPQETLAALAKGWRVAESLRSRGRISSNYLDPWGTGQCSQLREAPH